MRAVKILLVGDSGSGKTGALASLASAGYNLRILDFDNGTEILQNLLPPEVFASQVSVLPLQDQMEVRQIANMKDGKISGYTTKLVVKQADAYQRAVTTLTGKWSEKDPGNIYSWGPEVVLILDSLTHLWKCALRFVLAINNRSGLHPTQPEWGTVQGLTEDILATLFDSAVKCNVILTAHIDYSIFQDDSLREAQPEKPGAAPKGTLRGLPSGPGVKLNPIMGSYFNHMIRAVTRGQQHYIVTQSDGIVDLKTAAPGKVQAQYPIASGLADYFKDLQK